MQVYKKFLFIFLLMLISCKEEFFCEEGVSCPEIFAEENEDPDNPNDPDDPDNPDNDPGDETEQDDLIFVDENGESFFTGLDCGEVTGDYFADQSNLLEGIEIPDDLPVNFNLDEYIPPVDSQGKQGSCVSWAVTYYMKSMQEKIQFGHSFNRATIMSPAYTYNQITKGACGGTAVAATLDILKEKGTLSIGAFPYNENDCSLQPTPEQDEAAASAKILDYKSLSGNNMVNEMKALLIDLKPIIISAVLSKEFGTRDELGDAAYREHTVDYNEVGCHAMLVVGYDDFRNAFKVVNSWGTDWGNAGFVWIDYKAFENVSKPEEAFRVITAAHVAFDII